MLSCKRLIKRGSGLFIKYGMLLNATSNVSYNSVCVHLNFGSFVSMATTWYVDTCMLPSLGWRKTVRLYYYQICVTIH